MYRKGIWFIMFLDRWHYDELPLWKTSRLSGCGLSLPFIHFYSYDSKKKILVDVAAFTRKVMCDDTENHRHRSSISVCLHGKSERRQCLPLRTVSVLLGTCTRAVFNPGSYDVFMAKEELDFQMRMMQGDKDEETIGRCVVLTFI